MLRVNIIQLKPFTIVMFRGKIKSSYYDDGYLIHRWKEIKNILQEVNVTVTL